MAHITEPARTTPVIHECDLCVVGGSTTGVFAAIAAARLGLSVCVVENFGYFGGTATASLVCVWHTHLDAQLKEPIAGGLPLELMDRLQRRGAVRAKPTEDTHFTFNSTEMICELDRMVAEHRIRPFLHSRFVSPILEGSRVAAIVIEDATGRRAIRARFFIDATGDATLAHRAGLPTWQPAHLQPPTTTALFHGLDAIRAAQPGWWLSVIFDPKYPEAIRPGFVWSAKVPGTNLEMVAGTRVHGADCSDAEQLTAAEIEGRRQIRQITDLLRKHCPGGEQVSVAALPARIGIRHTRQIAALHRLTETEVLAGTRFPDAIANGSYRVDVHYHDGGGLVFRYLDGREIISNPCQPTIRRRWRPETPTSPTFYQIPYRALVPQESANLLVAGRCLDADEGAYGAVRVMINCAQTGQAAGVAAALCLEANTEPGSLDPQLLRRTLSAQGALIL